MQEILGFHHLSLSVTDLARSAAWYQEVLGLVVVAEMEGSGFSRVRLRPPGGGLTLTLTCHDERGATSFDEHRPGMDHVAFRVGGVVDVESFKDRVGDLGVDHSEIKVSDNGVAMITFRDPDGIQLEVIGGADL